MITEYRPPTPDKDYPNSIHYPCQTCGSKPGEKCTVPTENGHKPVNWFHYARSGHAWELEHENRKA